MSSTRSTRCSMRSYGVVELRRTTPTTRYPFASRNSARYDPSWPVTPVISAVGMNFKGCPGRRGCQGDRGNFTWITSTTSTPSTTSTQKKREPITAPSQRACRASSRRLFAARRAFHFARAQAFRAHLHLRDLAVDDDANHLKVGLPHATRLVVRVRDVVAERHTLAAREATIHAGHWSALDELDARHLRAIALAMARLENARVPAGPRRISRSDLLKQLVRRFTLAHVAAGEAPRVQRPLFRLRDQLLDEWAQLLRFRLGRLDLLVLDERRRQAPHQRELLLARAAQLATCLPVTHGPYSSSSGAAAAARLGGVPQSTTRTPSADSSYRMPKFKPSRSRRSAISCSDFLPKFLTCSIWLSVWRTRSPSVRMSEFLSEFTDRTDSSSSSIGVLNSCCNRAPSPVCSPPAATIAGECDPKLAKYWKCVCASAAA